MRMFSPCDEVQAAAENQQPKQSCKQRKQKSMQQNLSTVFGLCARSGKLKEIKTSKMSSSASTASVGSTDKILGSVDKPESVKFDEHFKNAKDAIHEART